MQNLLNLYLDEYFANYKKRKAEEAAEDDTSTPEGKIKQVIDNLEAGLISIETAVVEIFLITQEKDAHFTLSNPEDLKKAGTHFLMFLSFLKSDPKGKNGALIHETEHLIVQYQNGRIHKDHATGEINKIIGGVNQGLEPSERYPQFNPELFNS